MSILNWKNKVLGYTLQGGGGGGKGGGGSPPAQQTTQASNQFASLSPWAQPYVTNILGAAQQQVFQTDPSTGELTGVQPYRAYGLEGAGQSAAAQEAARSSVAEFSPLQQQAFTGAAGLSMPENYAAATGAAGLGTGQALTAQGRYQAQATDPYAVGAYMNPYVAQSLAPQLQLLAQQGGIQSAAQQGAATQAGAFGGSRSALANALAQQNNLLAQQQAIAQGYNTAFGQAQQAQQFGANLGLQGAQAGISGANALAGIGGQGLQAQQGILNLQNQYGTQQQQQQQNVINQAMQNYATAQQYPMTQLQQLSGLAQPYVTKDITTTRQEASPSAISQIAGLGTAGIAGLGLYNAMNKGTTP
jgi:hypothetical protein